MSRKPYMRMYWGDYLADTAHLKPLEHAAYLMLIAHYWNHEGLPDDDRQLSRITKMTLGTWMKMRPTIARFFAPGWKHKRIEAEISRVKGESETASKKAQSRWEGESAKKISKKRSKLFDEQAKNSSAASAEKAEESTDVECCGIEKNMPLQCQPEPEPDSRKESSGRGVTRRPTYEEITAKLKEAAGAEANPHPGLLVVGPILGLLDAGYDLDEDVLPVVRATAKQALRLSTWNYFVPAIKRAKAQRETARDEPAPKIEYVQQTVQVRAPAPDRSASGSFKRAAEELLRRKSEQQSDDAVWQQNPARARTEDSGPAVIDVSPNREGRFEIDPPEKRRP